MLLTDQKFIFMHWHWLPIFLLLILLSSSLQLKNLRLSLLLLNVEMFNICRLLFSIKYFYNDRKIKQKSLNSRIFKVMTRWKNRIVICVTYWTEVMSHFLYLPSFLKMILNDTMRNKARLSITESAGENGHVMTPEFPKAVHAVPYVSPGMGMNVSVTDLLWLIRTFWVPYTMVFLCINCQSGERHPVPWRHFCPQECIFVEFILNS